MKSLSQHVLFFPCISMLFITGCDLLSGRLPAPTTPPPKTTGNALALLALGDFNDDKYLDVANVNTEDKTVTVVFGNGDGSFGTIPSANYNVSEGASSIVVLDADGENGLDIAVLDSADGTISLLLNDGAGVFAAHGS